MGLAGMLPGEGVWDIRLRKILKDPGRYTLELRDPGTGVFSGPFNFRFPDPEYAVAWLSVLTELSGDDAKAIAALTEGKYLDTIGYSSNWVHVIRALYHCGGPIGGYPISTWWTDAVSGPDPIFVAYDPLQEEPEGYTTQKNAVEISEESTLIGPGASGREIQINRITILWNLKVSRVPVAIANIDPVEGDPFSLLLTRGPFLSEKRTDIMFFTVDGQWRVGFNLVKTPTNSAATSRGDNTQASTAKKPARKASVLAARPPAKGGSKGVVKPAQRITAKPATPVNPRPAKKLPLTRAQSLDKTSDKAEQQNLELPTEYVELFVDKDADRALDLLFVIADHGSFMRRNGAWTPFYFDGSYDPDGLEIVTIPRDSAKPFVTRWDEDIPITRDDLRPYEIPSPLGMKSPKKSGPGGAKESR